MIARLFMLFLISQSTGVWIPVGANSCLAEPGQVALPPAGQPRFMAQWGSEGLEPGEFHFPIGIAINAADEVFVTDFYNDRMQKFSTDGKLLAVIPVLPTPGGIALSRSGDIYLAHFAEKKREERTTDQISVYDSTGKLLRQWGRTGHENGEFDCPGPGGSCRRPRLCRRLRPIVACRFDGEESFWPRGEYGTQQGHPAESSRSARGWGARSFWPSTAKATSTPPKARWAAFRSSRRMASFCSPGEITRTNRAASAASLPDSKIARQHSRGRSAFASTSTIESG